MYLQSMPHYYQGSEQIVPRGRFLLLVQTKDSPCKPGNVYGVVRSVALKQLGHFMAGYANIGGRWSYVEGTYGNNGLPMDVESMPSDARVVPADLYEAWNKGGGHNGAGNEARIMRAWANAQFPTPREQARKAAMLRQLKAAKKAGDDESSPSVRYFRAELAKLESARDARLTELAEAWKEKA